MNKKLLTILFTVSIFANVFLLYKIMINSSTTNLSEKDSNSNICQNDCKENQNKVIQITDENNPIYLEGELKKEAIPTELELGDYWYWLYFDEPYLLMDNSAGVPFYIEKIQILQPESSDFYNFENFVDTMVGVHGHQTWGYAESSVFQVVAVREL